MASRTIALSAVIIGGVSILVADPGSVWVGAALVGLGAILLVLVRHVPP